MLAFNETLSLAFVADPLEEEYIDDPLAPAEAVIEEVDISGWLFETVTEELEYDGDEFIEDVTFVFDITVKPLFRKSKANAFELEDSGALVPYPKTVPFELAITFETEFERVEVEL